MPGRSNISRPESYGADCLRASRAQVTKDSKEASSPGRRVCVAAKGLTSRALMMCPQVPGPQPPSVLIVLTEGSKSTLVMLPPAPSRVWLAFRRPGGSRERNR